MRVLVVEDSPTIRARLTDILAAEPDIELVGVAADGQRGIALCQELRPDVVTMDMMLPLMSGLAATEYIMAHCPTPILVVSSSFNRGELFKMYDALAAGAVDVMEKPLGTEPEGDWERRFLATLRIVSRIRVITHPRGRLQLTQPSAPAAALRPAESAADQPAVVALGASTGGPNALVEVLAGLPVGFAVPVLIVMHINPQFAFALAEWLDAQTPHRVAFARDGQPFAGTAGRVLLAPADHHMVVRDGRIRLNRDPERHSCRPSVDVLFESVAREFGPTAVAALLTGMGRDGASGLLAIRQSGGVTVSQSEATCVVYGMPREAERLGASMHVLPLSDIGPKIAALPALIRRRAS